MSREAILDELFAMDGEVGGFDPKIYNQLLKSNPTIANIYADACLLEELYWRYLVSDTLSPEQYFVYRIKHHKMAMLADSCAASV